MYAEIGEFSCLGPVRPKHAGDVKAGPCGVLGARIEMCGCALLSASSWCAGAWCTSAGSDIKTVSLRIKPETAHQEFHKITIAVPLSFVLSSSTSSTLLHVDLTNTPPPPNRHLHYFRSFPAFSAFILPRASTTGPPWPKFEVPQGTIWASTIDLEDQAVTMRQMIPVHWTRSESRQARLRTISIP